MGTRFYERLAQVRYRALVLYDVCSEPAHHTRNDLRQYETYTGQMTNGSQKRMKKAVDLLCQIARPVWINNPVIHKRMRHTLSFITLTISGRERKVNTKEGNKQLLEPWLRHMRRRALMRSYIWKAEFQKNGQLHYHITTNRWIHYQLIRDTWNNILAEKGLTSNWDYSTGKSPNSTDVHSVYKQEDISKYLAKYMSKISKDVKADSKVWDCSMNIKKAKYFTIPASFLLPIPVQADEVIQTDFAEIVKVHSPIKFLPDDLKKAYDKYISDIDS